MPARITATVRRQGMKTSAIIVPVFLIAAMLVSQVFMAYGQDRVEAQRSGIEVVWAVFLLVALGRWIYGRSTAGRTVLDCGPNPARWVWLTAGVVFRASRLSPDTFVLRCVPSQWSLVSDVNGPSRLRCRLWTASGARERHIAILGPHSVEEYCLISLG